MSSEGVLEDVDVVLAGTAAGSGIETGVGGEVIIGGAGWSTTGSACIGGGVGAGKSAPGVDAGGV